MGDCRSHELKDLQLNDVQDLGKTLLVTITNTHTPRSFTIVSPYYDICKKYMSLRPPETINTLRFFLNYQHGKCTKQAIGINKFGYIPKQIAAFLNLHEPKLYTGHSLRRTSISVLVNTGANRKRNKTGGGLSAVAEQCKIEKQ